jgi:NCS2 family nucleobase:cation symporter-2
MAGGAGSPTFGSLRNWGVALFTLAAVTFFNHFTRGFMKLASILLGLALGYILALSLGMVNFAPVYSASWAAVPKPLYFGLSFPPDAVAAMVIMFIVNSIQAIGDISATTVGAMDREPSDKELAGGIMGNGLGSLLGAFLGGMPTATFSQNVGIVTITRVINKFVIAIAAVIILIAGLIPKFSAILTTIPQCVLGGATITVFAAITMTGMKLIVSAKLTARNTAIVGIAVALGVGVSQVGGALNGPGMPLWAGNIFGSASVMISTIAAVVLNILIPKEICDEPLSAERAAEIYEDPCEAEATLEETNL